jgi:hypothetical protein
VQYPLAFVALQVALPVADVAAVTDKTSQHNKQRQQGRYQPGQTK